MQAQKNVIEYGACCIYELKRFYYILRSPYYDGQFNTMNIDYSSIVGPEDSKQENFSALCKRLLVRLFPEAKPVDGSGGDEGADVYVGEFNGECHVYEHKYFLNRIRASQRRQIERSLNTAIKKHNLVAWTLMIPTELNPAEIKWFQKLKRTYPNITIDWWGKNKLNDLFSQHKDIVDDFQPKPSVQVILLNADLNIKTDDENKIINAIQESMSTKQPTPDLQKALRDAVNEVKRRTPLNILIWGPGESENPIYNKRIEIKNWLNQMGHRADFSEDVWDTEMLTKSGLNLTVAEFLQAKAYDYVVCLMDSPGSIGEVHDFSKSKSMASKMMICVDSNHKNGYSAQGTLRIFEGNNGKLDWFVFPDDIEKCFLRKRVVEQIQKVAEAKQYEVATGAYQV